jgi:hypothetical protein
MSDTSIISPSRERHRIDLNRQSRAFHHKLYAKSLRGISPLSMKRRAISKIWIYELFRIEPAVIETIEFHVIEAMKWF